MSRVPLPVNDQNKTYLPHSPERAELKARLAQMAAERIDIPLVIGGCEIRTGHTEQSVMPHNHRHVLADWHAAEAAHVQQAIDAALEARREWANWSLQDRAAVFLRAAELLTTTWRATAERRDDAGPVEDGDPGGDRFGVGADRLLAIQSALRAGALRGAADQQPRDVEQRGVPAARGLRLRGDALQLHVDCRQPSDRAGADGQHGDLEAGIERDAERSLHPEAARGGGPAAGRHQPRGRGIAAEISNILLDSPDLAGIHFTGSTAVFNSMWKRVGENIGRYRSYPRLVGETGGKDFIVAHPSADVQELAVAIVRGGFEYPGTEVLGGQPGLRAAVALARGEGSRGRDDARDPDGRRRRLPDVHGRRDRSQVVHEDQRLPGRCAEEREGDSGRRRQRRCRLLHRADADRDKRSRLPADVRGDLRAGRDGIRVSRLEVEPRRSTSWIARRRTR